MGAGLGADRSVCIRSRQLPPIRKSKPLITGGFFHLLTDKIMKASVKILFNTFY
jgi:hypothetical protein